MKTHPKLKETLSRIKRNKETLFAVLLGGTRWYTGGLALPLGFIVCRLLLERLKDYNVHKELGSLSAENHRLKNLLDEMNAQVIERHSASGPEEEMSKRIVELQKERDELESQLKAERQGKTSLESGQREALAIRDAEARQNRIFKKEIERLQSEMQKMKDLQAEISDKASIIATKEQNIADLEQGSSTKQSQIEELTREKEKLMRSIDSERESKYALNDSLEKERTMVQSLEAEVKKSQQEAGEKRQLYEISMKTLASEKEQSASLRANVLELTNLLDAERKTVQEQEGNLTMKEGIIISLREYESKALKLTEELRSKEEEILELKKNDESNKAVISSTRMKLSEVEEENKQVDKLKQRVTTFALSLKDRESQLSAVTEKYDATKVELETLQATHEALAKEQSALKVEFASSIEAQELLAAERKTTERLQNELDTLKESFMAATEKNSQLQRTLEQKTTIVDAKESMLAESMSRADMLQKQIDGMNEEMAQLTLTAGNVDSTEKRANEAEELLLVEQAKTTELEFKFEEMAAALKEETRKASQFESELNKKQRLIEVCETRIESLEDYKKKAEEGSEQVQEIQSEVSRLNNYLGSMKLNVDELEEALEEKEKQIAELNEINASLLSGKDQLNEQHAASKTEERRLQEQLKSKEMEMKMETAKLVALKKENEKLKEADLQAMQVLEDLKSSLETKELAIESKDSEIYRLKKVEKENQQLKEKEIELYKKLDNLTSSSNDLTKNLRSNLEKTQAMLKEEQWKVQSLREMLNARVDGKAQETGDLDESLPKDMKTLQSKYEAARSKVVTLEATTKTSQKMIRDLESILDKKETILAKKQDEIAALRRTLADVTESQAEHISESQKREISMKLHEADASQKIKLSDMLIVSSAFHMSAAGTNDNRMRSPKGKPTPESMNPWGNKRHSEAVEY